MSDINENSDREEEFRRHFPNTTPIKSAPPLVSLYGFGTGIIGRRNEDPETQTYVKTLVLRALFIPIFSLAAYRVQDAPGGGFYFIGKEKLSQWGRRMNIAVTIFILTFVVSSSVKSYFNSPEYKAQMALEKADGEFADQNYLEALKAYEKVFRMKGGAQKTAAVEGFVKSANTILASDSLAEVAEVSEYILYTTPYLKNKQKFPDLYKKSLEHAQNAAKSSPELAVDFLRIAEKLAGSDVDWLETKFTLLEEIASHQSPVSHYVANSLSESYEALGETDKIIALLSPIKESLADTEMARRLGSNYVNIGNYKEAIELLDVYTKTNRENWLAANSALDRYSDQFYNRLVDRINTGLAPQILYQKAESASQDEQDRLWNDYILEQMRLDPGYQACIKKIELFGNVPSALMDLGIAHLRYAQSGIPDAKNQLEAAEATLLSIGGFAGDSPDYQLFLGQVYYWLGKNDKGKEMFSKLQENFSDNASLLLNLAQTLRDIGKFKEAQDMATKAFAAAVSSEDKQSCATFAALVAKDNDERIEWLMKADTSSPSIIIRLNSAKADRALDENKTEEAITLFEKAIAGYEKLPENTTMLNNCALLHFKMFYISGDQQHYNAGLRKIDSAVKLGSNSPIISGNAATFYSNALAQAILSEKHEARFIQEYSSLDSLAVLYDSEVDRDKMASKVKQHPHFKKASTLIDKALTLAPQNASYYQQASELFSLTNDAENLESLLLRLQNAELDVESSQALWKEAIQKDHSADLILSYPADVAELEKELGEMQAPEGKAIAESALLIFKLSSWPLVEVTDLDNLYKKAEQLYVQHPNSHTFHTYKRSLFVKAAQEISKIHPDFKDWVKRSKGTIGDLSLLLLYVLHHDSPSTLLKDLAATSEYFKVHIERSVKFMRSTDELDVLVAKLIDSQHAERLGQAVNVDPTFTLNNKISRELFPYVPNHKLKKYWNLLLEKKTDEAKNVYQELAKDDPLIPTISL